jgi:hypothetical protein
MHALGRTQGAGCQRWEALGLGRTSETTRYSGCDPLKKSGLRALTMTFAGQCGARPGQIGVVRGRGEGAG